MRFSCGLSSAILLLSLGGCSPSYLLNVSSGGVPKAPHAGITYGDDERQAYDLYWPDAISENTPVLIFFYGGSWDSGRRADYAFVGNGLADDGFITAIVDYRVYPDVIFPTFVEDGAAAIAKILEKIGGKRATFLIGHSAGAQIAALLAFDPRYLLRHGLIPCETIQGFIGLAGPYDFLPLRRNRLRKIFPESIREQSQPINYVSALSPPTLLIHGADDTTVLPENSLRLAEALKDDNVPVTIYMVEKAGHIKIIAAVAGALKTTAPIRPQIKQFVDEILVTRPGVSVCG